LTGVDAFLRPRRESFRALPIQRPGKPVSIVFAAAPVDFQGVGHDFNASWSESELNDVNATLAVEYLQSCGAIFQMPLDHVLRLPD
jgi:hypothetical protein